MVDISFEPLCKLLPLTDKILSPAELIILASISFFFLAFTCKMLVIVDGLTQNRKHHGVMTDYLFIVFVFKN